MLLERPRHVVVPTQHPRHAAYCDFSSGYFLRPHDDETAPSRKSEVRGKAVAFAVAAHLRGPSAATEISCRPVRRKTMKSLLSSRPVLWFLFTFNLVLALAAGIGMHGPTRVPTSLGMAAVALGAGAGLRRGRREPRN